MNSSNFVLIPQHINTSTFGMSSYGSSGLGGFWSTTKIPLNIPQISLDQYYRKKLNKDRNLLFSDVDSNVSQFRDNLVEIVKEKEDEW